MGITLKKIIRGLKFFLARAPKFLNPALYHTLCAQMLIKLSIGALLIYVFKLQLGSERKKINDNVLSLTEMSFNSQ